MNQEIIFVDQSLIGCSGIFLVSAYGYADGLNHFLSDHADVSEGDAIVKGARSISKSCYRPAQFIDQVNIQVPEITEIMGVAVSRIAASDVVVPFRAISHTISAAILGIEIHGVVFRIENIRVGCRIAENEVFPDIVSAWINTFASAVILAEGKERIAGSGNGDG